MREAYHVTDKVTEWLPIVVTSEKVKLYKQLAKKGIYQCPYCEAELIVKYGEKREVHFSHKHSEACVESKVSDKAEKKYRKQVERENTQHKTIVDIFIDELKVTSRIKSNVSVDYGYRAKKKLKHFPDIWLKIDNAEIAISVVTNVIPNSDNTLAKDIKKRHSYFVEQGMHPVWFIENKELAIEKEKNAIVLWEAEENIALYTNEDKKWEEDLKIIAKDLSFFNLYNYSPSMSKLNIEVRSLYYIQSKVDRITVSIYRFMRDRNKKPFRAFLLGEGYDIPFSKALAVNEGSLNLSDTNVDESNRKHFIERHHKLVKQDEENEQLRHEYEEERRKEQEIQKKLQREQMIKGRKKLYEKEKDKRLRQEYEKQQRKEQEEQKKLQREQMIVERKKLHEKNESRRVMNYSELKVLLKKRINLTQQEQVELWDKFMLPKIGVKNAQRVWDLVEENDVKSFDELRRLLL